MTPLQQAYLARLHATAQANLEFLRLNMPEIHRKVSEGSPTATIDISDQGDLTIRHADGTAQPLPPLMIEYARRLAIFADPDERNQLLAFHNLRITSEEEDAVSDTAHYFYSRLDKIYPDLFRKHFTKHYPDAQGLYRYPVFGDEKTIPLLIVIGSGIGYPISRLLLDYQVRHLILLETDTDAFRLSCFFHDYVELSRIAMEKGTDLTFIIEPDVEQLSGALMNAMLRNLPPFFVHGAALFPAMPADERLEEITTMITDTLWRMFHGLGFFDDEIISIRHSFINLPRHHPVYRKPNVVTEEAFAFVVGAGPSLDGLLPLLQRHRARAVVISCGTALAALHQAGIRPDLHIEIERTALTYDVLIHSLPREFLHEIDLITTQVMEPRVLELFRSARIAIKEADTMGNLLVARGFIERPPLETQPTVTNMGLTLALGLGFKKICLFGVDVGYKDEARHHARDTVYHGKLPKEDRLRRLIGNVATKHLTAPGNFGGSVKTNFAFESARQHLSGWIRAHPAATVYNPNDGALIEGAVTIEAEDLARRLEEELPSPEHKARVLEQIAKAFEPIDLPLTSVAQALVEEFDRFDAELRPLLNRKIASRAEIIERIIDTYRLIRTEIVASTASSMLFRGTLLHLMSLCFNAASIIEDDDEAIAKATYDFGLILEFMEAARNEVLRAIEATAQ
ncbi:motility associated factor glycosyltransferase family protein [Sulfuricystis multivorans]|uniref:motility associated factor glycosyltransferase family protein n=1 Tax=Sulfuricystis multivorans TaxID=2211108 RepID=UPI000F8305BA|nr:6-hydroxymethylpterin diphosphokinase MptE-like protein [Sulfuricystis multivorans]